MNHTLNYYAIWLLFNISSLLSVHCILTMTAHMQMLE